ncbi:succinate--CoA ligase subunit alpha [Fervidicoccus fontis]|uniref:Succinate--CoA ligase [ADP-forming] subunit alpha n=2 Tax=Fervidicoccus fontis TaxID=683846 RepID=I0A047_FERFK|nr:succinate--CoA ligase subunit alpha [Fervidicoccus fontis]AFH42354.1 Succinyl-CoA synthetase alpha chain [Fervidicoccus fontis Kam940]MBE9391716.1 succinate--CoA ligase subunit alpha [Fervidicoccus fontis]PMB76639.1 MAG: succinate--CoA ligase subunit alpha [Fervidicoccus fontis]HEW63891.1 succinate--CoA ligase subunit alpha [Fervidicoccus fontis]
MAILVNKDTKVLVQGITGKEGSFHTKLMLEYGTKIVAGVSPGKEGQEVYGVKVYNSVENAMSENPHIDASIIFVPAAFTADAVYEAIKNKIKNIIVITEGIPVHETMKFVNYANEKGIRIIGPNCPGIIVPNETKIGIMPGSVFTRGPVGIMSRSGTLTYEISYALSREGIGQSTVIGVGGDPIIGLNFIEVMKLFNDDKETKAVVMVGEIGGDIEERVAMRFKKGEFDKPIVAYIAGKTAPPGKRMGHAGAIITMGEGTYEGKIKALENAGIPVAKNPFEIPKLISKLI